MCCCIKFVIIGNSVQTHTYTKKSNKHNNNKYYMFREETRKIIEIYFAKLILKWNPNQCYENGVLLGCNAAALSRHYYIQQHILKAN